MFPAAYKQAKRRDDQRGQRYRRLEQRRLGQVLQESIMEVQEQMEEQEQEQIEQQEQDTTEAVQQADDIRAREKETAEALLSMAEAGVTREQGVQTEEDLMK